MEQPLILIIDDDKKLNQLLKQYFRQFEFNVHTETHPEKGLQFIENTLPHLIILDVMLPNLNGFEVCKRIRQEYTIPIIMLTARGEVTDRVLGLELGADDYLPKPFEPRELVARIQSILRRTSQKIESKTSVYTFENLSIDTKQQVVFLDQERITLTTMEFDVLLLFAKNPNQVFSRDQILEHLRGMEADVFSRSIDILMSRLRQKLKDSPKNPKFFKTIWGSGYIFLPSPSE